MTNIRFLIVLLGTLFNYSVMHAQVDDSITDKIDQWILIADSAKEGDLSLKLAKYAFNRSKEIDYPLGIFKSYSIIARSNLKNENYQEAIKNASRALRVYNENDHLDLNLARVHIIMSSALEKIGAYSDAIKHWKSALKYQLQDTTINSSKHIIYYSLSKLGALFMELEMYDSSLVYFNKAQIFANQKNSLKYSADILNNIGLVYNAKGYQDSAIIYYQGALSLYSKMKHLAKADMFMISLIKGNLAMCLPDDDPLKEQYFLEDIKGSMKFENYWSVINTYIEYAIFLMDENRFTKAESILKKAETLANSKNIINNDTYIKLHDVFVQYYIHSGREKLALVYLKKQQKLIQEIYGKKVREKLLEIHSSYKLSKIEDELDLEVARGEKKVAQIEALNKENKLIKFRYSTYALVVFLLVVVLVVIIIKVRGDAKKKAKEKEFKNKLLQQELEHNTDRLNRSVLGLTRKREFAEELIKRLSFLDNLNPAQKNSLKLFVRNELEIDKSVLDMEKVMKEVGKEFISHLKLKYPKLSESDLKLLGFIKMKLTNKQIAEIKNISPESVKIAKNRLRKKLDMSPGSDFIEYLRL